MGTSKKSKNGKKSQFKMNWKILIVFCCLCVAVGIGFGIFAIVKKANAKVLDVAFYDLPQQITDELKSSISGSYEGKIKYYDVEKSAYNKAEIIKKYDLFFAWDGAVTDSLKDVAKLVPEESGYGMPESIFGKRTVSVPIMLDHYQISFNDTIRHAARIRYPQNLDQFRIYLDWIKDYVRYPFYCAGGDDEMLMALLSCFIESYGGTKSYESFIENLKSAENLKAIVDLELGDSAKTESFSLHSVLDLLRDWQKAGLIPENWLAAHHSDVKNFAQDNLMGVVFTSLSNFRIMPYNSVSQFSLDRFPVKNMEVSHSLMAPALLCVNLSDSHLFDNVVLNLVSDDTQSYFSMQTGFAPVSSHARTYDRQADDVRFLAAACAGGPKPAAYAVVFQLDEKRSAEILNQIRFYLKTGIL